MEEFDQDRPIAVYGEEAAFFRCSGVAGCSRAMVASLLGMDEAGLWESANTAAAAGHAIEPQALDMLEERGWVIKARQVPCAEEIAPGIVLEGRADAVAVDDAWGEVPHLVEVKSLGAGTFDTFLRDPVIPEHWGWQMTCYMKLLKLDRALLVVVSREEEPRIHITQVDAPPADINQIIEHLYEVIAWAEEGDLPACDRVSPFCRYWYLHEEEDLPAVEDDQLDFHAMRYKALGKAIGSLETVRKQEQETLAELMGDQEMIRTKSVLVRWVVQNRKRTDTKGMAQMLMELGGDPEQFIEPYEVRYIGTWLAGRRER